MFQREGDQVVVDIAITIGKVEPADSKRFVSSVGFSDGSE